MIARKKIDTTAFHIAKITPKIMGDFHITYVLFIVPISGFGRKKTKKKRKTETA